MKSQEDDDNEPIGEAKALGLNFETIHNIDEYATETVTTMREALKVNKIMSLSKLLGYFLS